MNSGVNPAQKPRFFSMRRLALLAGVASIGAAVALTTPGFLPKPGALVLNGVAYAQAQNSQRPVGFADIVEGVKPAVISVRVKMDAGARVMGFDNSQPNQQGTPMDRFSRRFGLPEG